MSESKEFIQNVKTFIDEESISIQKVFLEMPQDGEFWAVISHDGNEISLSVKNFKELIKLFNNSIVPFDKRIRIEEIFKRQQEILSNTNLLNYLSSAREIMLLEQQKKNIMSIPNQSFKI